jgi:choline dehydrogenase
VVNLLARSLIFKFHSIFKIYNKKIFSLYKIVADNFRNNIILKMAHEIEEIGNLIPSQFFGKGVSDLEVDYIIIGSGPAGCVLGRRLSDDCKNSVLMFEAGENFDDDHRICCESGQVEPAFASTIANFFNQFFYPGTTIIQTVGGNNGNPGPPTAGGNNGMLQYTGGRIFGGGSSVNGQIWYRGSAANYDEWVAGLDGDKSWSPKNVGKIFKHLEKYNGTSQNPETRGKHGHVDVRQTLVGTTENNMVKAFQAMAAGTPAVVVDDYNTEPLVGPAVDIHAAWQVTEEPLKTDPKTGKIVGKRESASKAFLSKDVVERIGEGPKSKVAIGKDGRNLLVIFKATVVRIIFDESKDKPRAIGVEWIRDGIAVKRAFARRRVISCAGINDAKILQLSGVGPSKVLKDANVRQVVKNEAIGVGLQDQQLIFPLFLSEFGTPSTPTDPVVGYIGGAALPDPRSIVSPNLFDPNRRATEFYAQVLPSVTGPQPIVILITENLRPTSKGSIVIQNGDPFKPTLVDYGWLSDADSATLVAILQTYVAAFSKYVTTNFGWIDINGIDYTNVASCQAYINKNVSTSFHYAGSVKMASKANGGAVDGMGQVYGATHLHVASNSIQPITNDGNPQANSYMIGWKISEDIMDLDKCEKPAKFKFGKFDDSC